MPEADATGFMLEHGLTPVEPYLNSWSPWRCKHTCGRIVTPTMSNVRAGHGICRYCNSSFPFDGEAEVYLVADANALKIGCAAFGGDRVNQHLRMGWTEQWRIKTETGDAAYALEHGVLTWWRESLGAPAYYTSDRMPQWGATETVAWESAGPEATLAKTLELAQEWGFTVEMLRPMTPGEDVRPTSTATNIGPRARRRAAATAAMVPQSGGR